MTKFNAVKDNLDLNIFKLPLVQNEKCYFPSFIRDRLSKYLLDFKNIIGPIIDENVILDTNEKDFVYNRLQSICNKLNESIDRYYQGHVKDSYLIFEDAMNDSFFENIKPISVIKKGAAFYRTRKDNGSFYTKKDMFHVGFENRHLIKTNRYSISGLPALYVGDSAFVCWAEFDRSPIDKMWFTRIENQKEINIISIQRIEDLLAEIENVDVSYKMTYLLRYFVLFPFILACSVKVINNSASFKPEYIIPQFLMQYISN